ncbi:MAG: N-acetylmuramoyl-L-alanine amidase [Deltaproteobacteria bacterium]|nr:N-acetylmuramoyl-L-alanine amidase [Deltaproteobacteria bacterium]
MLLDRLKLILPYILIGCMLSITGQQVSFAATSKDTYHQAEACYKKLRHSPKKQKYRENWLLCIEKFKAVYRHNPSGSWAPAGLYMAGVLYEELYGRSFKTSDKENAFKVYDLLIKRYPKSKYRQKAENAKRRKALKKTPKTTSPKVIPEKNDARASVDSIETEINKASSTQDLNTKESDPGKAGNVEIVGLRYWSNPNYTRVVIDADNELSYAHRLLKKDTSINKPQRLYVDLNNSRLGKDIKKHILIDDNLLMDTRAGQFSSNQVRVVVDIKSFKTYKIFSLKNPFRIVIDVWGKDPRPTPSVVITDKKGDKIPAGALAKQLSLGVRRIVIDPGHGGRDYGAPGYLKGVYEKNISLKIARRLADKIRKKLNCKVIMTRNSDRNLSLEERTAIANTKNADLFISIHTNASRDRRVYGIETFFLNLATDNDAILVAARENATSTKNISDLQSILSDLMQNAKINESSRLAGHVQGSLKDHLRKYYSRIKSKGVKQAPFYVLLGAQMPAILIETSFISNSRECKRLVNQKYQDRMCDAIVRGIQAYIRETNPTAFMEVNPIKDSGKYGG